MKLHIIYENNKEQLLHQNYIKPVREPGFFYFENTACIDFSFHERTDVRSVWIRKQTQKELEQARVWRENLWRQQYMIDPGGSYTFTYGRSGGGGGSGGTIRVTDVDTETRSVTVDMTEQRRASHEEHLRAHREARQQMLAAQSELARRAAQRQAEETRLEAERTRARTPWQRFRNLWD